jgi:ATP-dependent DNA ligase
MDGELYRHGMSLQEINSRVAVMRTKAHDKVALIEYHVFDLIFPDSSFHKRWLAMKAIVDSGRFDNTPIKFVETFLVHSEAEADYYYRRFKSQNYEGMMYRCPHSGYGIETRCTNKENRWNCLLKRKEMVEGEAVIRGFHEGEGQFQNALGAFELEYSNGMKFSAGSGLTHQQRFHYWQRKDTLWFDSSVEQWLRCSPQ